MARYIKQGTIRDGLGNVISEATVYVYLGGTTTAASVYVAVSGGTAVNSVETDTDGKFLFYVDTGDYDRDQSFKIVISKTGYTSQTWDYIYIILEDIDDDTVVNEGTSTTSAIAIFDDDLGKSVESSGVLIDASDNITGVTSILVEGNIYLYDAGGEYISGDGTDLTLTSSAKINLTAVSDVIVPVNVGIVLGDGAEKIESNNTDLTVNSGGAINLTATSDVVIPANVGITFGTGEKIEGDSTDLTITSGAKINLTATSDVVVPVNIGIILGDGAEKIESNNTDLTINSGGDIALTATGDVNIPANIGVVFGDDGEKIEGDGTDLTITSSGKLNLNSTGVLTASSQTIGDNAVVTVDSSTAATGEYAKFTANGLESKSIAEVQADLSIAPANATAANSFLVSGADPFAYAEKTLVNTAALLKDQFPQAITDNHVLTVDSADAADDEYARFTANGLEGRTASEVYSNLLAQVLLENDAIKLDAALSADGKWNGITRTGTAGATLAFGDVCYFAVADSRWELADADSAAKAQGLLGICVLAAANDGDATNILLIGMVRADTAFPSFTVGAPVFLSTTDGDLSSTAPSGTGDIIRIVGQAWTADELWFCPSPDFFEYTA